MDEKQKIKSKVQQVIDATALTDESITSDVNGSYTGIPLMGDMPVQDVDDL